MHSNVAKTISAIVAFVVMAVLISPGIAVADSEDVVARKNPLHGSAIFL
jgi:hypothetical protein